MSSTMFTGTCLSSLLSTFLPYAHLVEVLTALSGKTALAQFEVLHIFWVDCCSLMQLDLCPMCLE